MVCLQPQCTTVGHTRVRSLSVMSRLYRLTSSTQFVGQGGEPVIPQVQIQAINPVLGPTAFAVLTLPLHASVTQYPLGFLGY